MATRSPHTEAVSALNASSHEPKSDSIADLVAAEVVSGPGVNRIGSFTGAPSWCLRSRRMAVCRRPTPAERGILEAAALERARALEDRIGRRAQVRMHALQIAQDVEVER